MSAVAELEITEPRRRLDPEYFRSVRLLQRVHRQLLDVVKSELDRQKQTDVNSVQALLLFNIGDAELTAGELRSRGHYVGSNVSYNLKKLVEAGYIRHERSPSDRRSVRVRLSEEGQRIRAILGELFGRQLVSLGPVAQLDAVTLGELNDSLQRLERFWSDHIRYRL